MSNQPQPRPLFRTGSRASPAPALYTRAPAPQTQTDPTPPPPRQTRPVFRPLFSQTFGPSATQPVHEAPPGPQAPNTTTPSAPTTAAQPPPQPVATASSIPPTAAAAPPLRHRAAAPASPSPHDVVPPPPPPAAAPPSPPPPSTVSLTPKQSNAESRLPHEAEKKTVVKEMIVKAKPHLEPDKGEVMESQNAKQMNQKDGHMMYSSNTKETGSSVRIINIAGENKGALMKLGFSSKKQVGGHAAYPDTEPTRNKGRSRVMKSEAHEVLGNGSLPREPIYVNSNVHVVNNSIVNNSSCSYNNPGVHYSYSRMSLND